MAQRRPTECSTTLKREPNSRGHEETLEAEPEAETDGDTLGFARLSEQEEL